VNVPEHDRSIPHVGAHEHSSNHREEIERSDASGLPISAEFLGAMRAYWFDA
jgi:hypothetical protein